MPTGSIQKDYVVQQPNPAWLQPTPACAAMALEGVDVRMGVHLTVYVTMVIMTRQARYADRGHVKVTNQLHVRACTALSPGTPPACARPFMRLTRTENIAFNPKPEPTAAGNARSD